MKFDNLKGVMDEIVDWRIPGCDIMVEKDGNAVFRYQAGFENIEKGISLSPDAMYYIFSATKPITAAAAMCLMEEGKIHPDDEVGKYISSFNDIKVRVKDEHGGISFVPAQRNVRIIDLLSMTAGLDYDICSPEIEAVKKNTDGRAPTLEIAEAIGRTGLIAQPGERYIYSICLDVVGAVIESASGEKFGDFLNSRILSPLGMNDTYFKIPKEKESRLIPLYIYDREKCKPVPDIGGNRYILGSEYESGGAGLISTVEDMMKFCAMLSNLGVSKEGKRIISEKYVNFMRENHLEENTLRSFRNTYSYLKGYGYGCGVRTAMEPSCSDIYLSVGEFGWCGAAGAMVLSDPSNRLAVYYAQHMRNNQEWIVHPKLKEALYKDLGF